MLILLLGYTVYMDNLQDLLSNNNFAEPVQVKALKEYIRLQYETSCDVAVTPRLYVLSVASASLASNLQLERNQIAQQCNLDKPLRIRVGV